MKCGKVSIIIPCHNGWAYTKLCLTSVLKSDYPNFDIIVVDDGSTDPTSKFIVKEFPNVQVLNGDGNLWWSGSMNLGIEHAIQNAADYILVLNNDIIIAPDTISVLMNCSKKNPEAIIGSMVFEIDQPDLIWSAGGIMKWPWPGEVQSGVGELNKGQYNGLREVSWTPGMGTLIKRSILLQLNFYDKKNMPQYIADVDFCLRARKAGYPILISSDSRIFNNTENTGGIINQNKRLKWRESMDIFTSLKSADYLRARLVFIFRHCPWYFWIPALIIRYTRLFVFVFRRVL